MSQGGYRYYVHFLDDFSRFAWIYPLKSKSDTITAFSHLLSTVKNQSGTLIKAFQLDNGGELKHVHQVCTALGINSQLSCPYTSTQNGLSLKKT